jgi:electron transfer flavoprotein alpha subunit
VANLVVFVEVRRGAATAASRHAVGEARRIAGELGATVYALVATGPSSVETLDAQARTLGEAGADRVLCCADPLLEGPLLDGTAGPLLAQVSERLRPVLTLFPAGTVGAALGAPLSLRVRGQFLPRASLAVIREQGSARLVARRLRAGDGALRTVPVGHPAPPVVATLPSGEPPPPRGQPTPEVESLPPVPPGAAAGRVRELERVSDEGEVVELAPALLAVSAGLDAAARRALEAAAPQGVAFIDEAAGQPGLPSAFPARLLLVGRGPAPQAVRGTLGPQTRVGVAGPKAAEKDLPRLDLVWRPAAREGLASVAEALAAERLAGRGGGS